MADYLQNRRNPLLDAWWATPPQPNALAPYAPAVSEFTTPADLQRERISNAMGWDVGHPGDEFLRRLPLLLTAARAPAARSAPRPEFSLSPNRANDPMRFEYNILRDGRSVGDVRGLIRDGQAEIYGISGLRPNAFGPAAMRQLRDAFQRDFPGVTRIGGQRGGGARPFGSRQDIDLP